MEKYLFEVEEFFDWLELLTDENTISLGAKILEDKVNNSPFYKSSIGISTIHYIEGFNGSFILYGGFYICGKYKEVNFPMFYHVLYYSTYNLLIKTHIYQYKRQYLYENSKKHS